jgi:hypothetical protein
VRGDEDNEDSNIDGANDNQCAPLDSLDRTTVFCDKCNPIDDDLHKKLNLKNPEEEDKEEEWNTIVSRLVLKLPLV